MIAKVVLGAIGRRIKWRWVVEASLVAGACLLGARFIDELFTFAVWLKMAVAAAATVVVVWECASLYYTGKFDKIGDGVKPPVK